MTCQDKLSALGRQLVMSKRQAIPRWPFLADLMVTNSSDFHRFDVPLL